MQFGYLTGRGINHSQPPELKFSKPDMPLLIFGHPVNLFAGISQSIKFYMTARWIEVPHHAANVGAKPDLTIMRYRQAKGISGRTASSVRHIPYLYPAVCWVKPSNAPLRQFGKP